MKNRILLIVLLITSFSCKAQSVLPVERVVDYWGEGIPEHITEVKDVNGLLNKFIGTWKGTQDNQKFEIIIVRKISQSVTGRNLIIEELLLRYKITDNKGVVIEDTTNLPSDSYLVMFGKYLSKQGQYVLYYQGSNANCGQNGDVFLSVNPNDSNEMDLSLSVYGEMSEDCTAYAGQVLPTDGIILTKQ